MNLRSVTLYFLGVSSLAHKVRHDLAKEIVVGTCSLVLLTLFFHIFNDFINVEVKSLSSAMRDTFASSLSIILLIIATALGARLLAQNDARSFSKSATYLGETPSTVRTYLLFRSITCVALTHGIGWYICLGWFANWNNNQILLAEVSMLGLTAILYLLAKIKKGTKISFDNQKILDGTNRHPSILAGWRLRQMLFRSRLTKSSFVLAFGFALIVTLTSYTNTPIFVGVLAAYMCGFLAATSLSFQLSDDLGYAWAERSLGISHDDFMKAYHRIGLMIGVVFGLTCGVSFFLAGGVETSLEAISTASKIAVIAALPPIIMPLFIFQIDGRRPAISIIALFIIGIFLITAIYAHWLSVFITPFLHYYATDAQKGRFYRA